MAALAHGQPINEKNVITPADFTRSKRLFDALPLAAIPLLSDQQRAYWQQLLSQLIDQSFALCTQHAARGRHEANDYYALCVKYLALQQALAQQANPAATNAKWSPLNYLTINDQNKAYLDVLTQLNKKQTDELHAVTETMGVINYHRLYWIWAGGNGGLLDCTLYLPQLETLLGKQRVHQMSQNLNFPSKALGYFSWVLYFCRLAVNLTQIIRHANNWQQAKEEWQDRKFEMLNDIVWGAVNIATFFWLTTQVSNRNGLIGAWLTVFLMAFDVIMASWELKQQTAAYRASLLRLTTEQTVLQNIAEPTPKESAKLALINDELKQLNRDWHFEKKQLKRTLLISILFTPAMAMMYAMDFALYLPAMAAAAPWIAVAGCVIAVALTVFETWADFRDIDEKFIEQLNDAREKALTLANAITQPNDDKAALGRLLLAFKCNQLTIKALESTRLHNQTMGKFAVAALSGIPVAIFFAIMLPPPLMLAALVGIAVYGLVTRRALQAKQPSAILPENCQLAETDKDALQQDAKALIANTTKQPATGTIAPTGQETSAGRQQGFFFEKNSAENKKEPTTPLHPFRTAIAFSA